jgi:iron(III) transport system substrate-binding protein
MKKTAILFGFVFMLTLCFGQAGWAAAQIETELVIQTPVTKFITDAASDAFQKYAKKTWGLDVKVSGLYAGTPVCYGKIVEWNGKPQADIFWGGESALFDKLAEKGLLEKITLSKAAWDAIPCPFR